jgi:putative DNA primase/helicase
MLGLRNGHKQATTDKKRLREVWVKRQNVNIGIRVGVNSKLLVVDVDNKGTKNGSAELEKLEDKLGPLPRTYSVRTPTSGYHFYFTYPQALIDKPLKAKLSDGIDLKFKGYVVAPPSVTANGEYEVILLAPVSELPAKWVQEVIKPELDVEWRTVERPRGSSPSICDEYHISLSDVLDIPANAKKTSEGYLIKHPIHGATGVGNMSVNTSKGLWHCFRCDTGGDALTWVAVREGFIHCEDAGPLDRDTIKKCLDVLRSEGRVPDEAAIRKTVITTGSGGKEHIETLRLRRLDALDNAERFLERHGETLRWCRETKRWHLYNGSRWVVVSNDYVKRCARDVVWMIREEATLVNELRDKSPTEKEELVKKYNAWARETAKRYSLESIIDSAKADLEISIHEFDRDPLLFNCENGTFDIRTGELLLHSAEDYLTHYCDVPYEKGFENSKWASFLKKVIPIQEVRDFLKRAAGYSTTAYTNEEASFFCYGEGATGKSTFLESMLGSAASYGRVAKFSTFLADRSNAAGGPREDITRLIGLRMTVCNEVNKNMRFNSALVKTFISGESYNARVPYSRDSIDFEPVFKLWLAANDRPKIDYNDEAAFRRFFIIPFKVYIPPEERDRGLKNYFKTGLDARKAVLAWMLEGAVEWWRLSDGGTRDGLQAPPEVLAAVAEYKAVMNPLFEFIEDECAVGCDDMGYPFEESTEHLWLAYQRNGYDIRKVKGTKSVGKYLKALGLDGFKDHTGNVQTRKWRYIRLLDDDGEQPTGECPVRLVRLRSTRTESYPCHPSCREVCEILRSKRTKCTEDDEKSDIEDTDPDLDEAPDQADTARDVLNKLKALRSASATPEKIARESVIGVIAEDTGKSTDYIERLFVEDKTIEALVAELTG